MSAIAPRELAYALKWVFKDKVVCDIGCGNGQLLSEISKYAKEVIGIEKNIAEIKEAKGRGIKVIEGIAEEVDIPDADVYYIWVSHPYDIIKRIKKGLIIVGACFLGMDRKFDFENYPRFSKVCIPYPTTQMWDLAIYLKDAEPI